MTPLEKEFILKFLKQEPPVEAIEKNTLGENIYSCLSLAINDAQIITGRSPSIEEIENIPGFNIFVYKNPMSLTGTLNYLLILDIIGTIFRFKDARRNISSLEYQNEIYKAIKQFSPQILSIDEIHALVALRHSLTHKFSLVNIGTGKWASKQTHRFLVIDDEHVPLVKLPLNQWNPKSSFESDTSCTKISIPKLCTLVEGIIINLKTMIANDEINLIKTIQEVKDNYTIIM